MKKEVSRKQVLNSQKELTRKHDEIRAVQSALEVQNQVVAKGVGDMGIPELENQRDDLAAAIALGHGEASKLNHVESLISQARGELTKASSEVNRAQAAVAGLGRKLSDLNAEFSEMQREHAALLLEFYRAEADTEHAVYVECAKRLKTLYLRVLAYSELSKAVDQRQGNFVPAEPISLPVAAQFESGKGIRYVNDGLLFSSSYMGYFPDLSDAVEALRNELQFDGIVSQDSAHKNNNTI